MELWKLNQFVTVMIMKLVAKRGSCSKRNKLQQGVAS